MISPRTHVGAPLPDLLGDRTFVFRLALAIVAFTHTGGPVIEGV